jgi:hypothetical protein
VVKLNTFWNFEYYLGDLFLNRSAFANTDGSLTHRLHFALTASVILTIGYSIIFIGCPIIDGITSKKIVSYQQPSLSSRGYDSAIFTLGHQFQILAAGKACR